MALCANSFPSCDVIYLPVIIVIAFEEGRLQGEVVLVNSILSYKIFLVTKTFFAFRYCHFLLFLLRLKCVRLDF